MKRSFFTLLFLLIPTLSFAFNVSQLLNALKSNPDQQPNILQFVNNNPGLLDLDQFTQPKQTPQLFRNNPNNLQNNSMQKMLDQLNQKNANQSGGSPQGGGSPQSGGGSPGSSQGGGSQSGSSGAQSGNSKNGGGSNSRTSNLERDPESKPDPKPEPVVEPEKTPPVEPPAQPSSVVPAESTVPVQPVVAVPVTREPAPEPVIQPSETKPTFFENLSRNLESFFAPKTEPEKTPEQIQKENEKSDLGFQDYKIGAAEERRSNWQRLIDRCETDLTCSDSQNASYRQGLDDEQKRIDALRAGRASMPGGEEAPTPEAIQALREAQALPDYSKLPQDQAENLRQADFKVSQQEKIVQILQTAVDKCKDNSQCSSNQSFLKGHEERLTDAQKRLASLKDDREKLQPKDQTANTQQPVGTKNVDKKEACTGGVFNSKGELIPKTDQPGNTWSMVQYKPDTPAMPPNFLEKAKAPNPVEVGKPFVSKGGDIVSNSGDPKKPEQYTCCKKSGTVGGKTSCLIKIGESGYNGGATAETK